MLKRFALLLAVPAAIGLVVMPRPAMADGGEQPPAPPPARSSTSVASASPTPVTPSTATPVTPPAVTSAVQGTVPGGGKHIRYDLTRPSGEMQLTLTQTGGGCFIVPGDETLGEFGFTVFLAGGPQPSTTHPTQHCTSRMTVPPGTADVLVDIYNYGPGPASFTLVASDTTASLRLRPAP